VGETCRGLAKASKLLQAEVIHPAGNDLQRMNAGAAARALHDFIRQTYAPGKECALWSPEQAARLGYIPSWRVSWEAGPAECSKHGPEESKLDGRVVDLWM
jgi:hypothetical protein